MLFEPIDLSKFNEQDVREEILAPIIRCLGYRRGTSNDVIRELSLRYPRIFLGRKKSKKDPIIRGEADYIFDIDKKWRGSIPILQEDKRKGSIFAILTRE
jgi:hypothetical protein